MAELVVLVAEWERVRRAAPDRDESDVLREIVKRGAQLARAPLLQQMPADVTGPERLQAAKTMFAQWAAEYTWMRFRYFQQKPEADAMRAIDNQVLDETNELQEKIIPELRARARELRAEVRALEAEAASRGIDTATIEPAIDWSKTMAVEEYQPVRMIIPDALGVRIRRRIRRLLRRERHDQPDSSAKPS